jgi:hypothetical protein
MSAKNSTVEIDLLAEKFHRTITSTDDSVVDTTTISSIRIHLIISHTGDADVMQAPLIG